MKKAYPIITLIFLLFISCAEIMQVVQTLELETEQPLTQTEIISGLKEALVFGTDSATFKLGKIDGYYRDELVKIMLPSEADILVDNINRIPGGKGLLEDVIQKINRAAEDAASEAAPIFLNSIRDMNIQDAIGILNGEKNAATMYFRRTTFNQLFNLYRPKIKASLDKKLIGNISTIESWDYLTDQWNQIAGSFAGQLAGLRAVDVVLDEYLTNKALDGLFLKIEEEERQIREDPLARVTNLLKRVFGSIE